MIPLYPIKFEPILKERIWGGEKLIKTFKKESDKINIGDEIDQEDEITIIHKKNHNKLKKTKNIWDTKKMIDTILYSPDKDKIALFVIVKKPTYRKLIASDKYEYYYDGYCAWVR